MKKQHHKSKKEILADLKKNKEFMDKLKFTKEVFFPALCRASVNIDDAQILLSGFNTTIMQEFLALMKNRRLGELDLGSKLDSLSPKYTENLELLKIFEDMTIFEAKDYIEGMRSEIQLFITDEMKDRPLESLKTKWVDEYLIK